MKTLHLSIIIILFVAGAGIVFAQSNNTQIQNGVRSTNSTCTDYMIQDMKTKYASFDEERAKTEAVNYDAFKSEVKNDKYIFRAVSQEWINDQVKCNVTFKTALILFVVTDSSGKDRDVTVLINPVSYKPQGIDVKYDVPTHGGVITIMLSPLKQFKSGIAANDVKCKQGLQLVIRAEDGSPACIKPQTVQKLVERGWGWVMQTIDSLKPLMPNRIAGLENDTGLVTFGNQTYYFETPNYTDTAFTNPVQISFHDVVFTLFPSGFKGGLPTDFGGVATNGCDGSYFWTDAKFPDGIHELLHLFAITTMSQHCQVLPAPTDFSTHANPQAGLTFYNGKMKLLVNTNTLNSDMTSDHVVDLISIKSVPPVTPGGPTIQITLKNNNAKPITSLNATLDLNNSYVFDFKNVTQLQPLTSGNSIYETKILIGGGFSSESTYIITINGIADNIPFSYSENVTIPYTKEIVGNTTTLHASFEPCDTPYPQSNTGVAVLYMPANSIGKICVRYSNLNDAPAHIFGIRFFEPNNPNQNATGITTWNDIGNNYTIPKGDSTVVYWIKTGNQTGFYGLDLFCGEKPFAVGYDNNSRIVSSDFPWLGGTIHCPMMTYQFHIDSMTGVGVKYISYP